MQKAEKHLAYHLAAGIELISDYGVEVVSDGVCSCIITGKHPRDSTGRIDIMFDGVSARQLIIRFGIQ